MAFIYSIIAGDKSKLVNNLSSEPIPLLTNSYCKANLAQPTD